MVSESAPAERAAANSLPKFRGRFAEKRAKMKNSTQPANLNLKARRRRTEKKGAGQKTTRQTTSKSQTEDQRQSIKTDLPNVEVSHWKAF